MDNIAKISKLREIIKDKLVPLIDSDYVLLDVPNHPNIGDNLIWEGELIFLNNQVRHKLNYSANVYNINLNEINDEIILFHGGGNFGDLYPECQNLRLEVINKFPNNKIIVLPQTVYYSDIKKLEYESSIYINHKYLTICVRDKESYDILSKYIPKEKISLLPDMAFYIDFPLKTSKSINKALIMHRTDQEKINTDYIALIQNSLSKDINIKISDWPTYSNNKYINHISYLLNYQKIKLSIWLQKFKITNKLVSPEYGLNSRNKRNKYINIGVQLFTSYEYIYTTRLHGMILGILLNKKVFIVDNKYKKCSNFYNTWLREFDDVKIMKK